MKIFPQNIIEKIKENYVVGVLASEGENLPRLGDDDKPVTYSDKVNDVLFYIKPISYEPKIITQIQEESFNMSEYYIGFAGKSISNMPTEVKHNIDKKIEYIRGKLEGKILLFKPFLNQDQKNERYHKNIEDLILEEEDWVKGEEYIPIPKYNSSIEEFEKKLLEEEGVIELKQYNNAMPLPLYIQCEDYIYGNIKENSWRIESKNNNSFVMIAPNQIKKVKISDNEIKSHVGPEREHLSFFNDEFINTTIADRLDYEEKKIYESKLVERFKSEKGYVSDSMENNNDNQLSSTMSEEKFILHLESRAKSRKLIYGKEDLINFHASVKSSAFTILSGQSGIGKTQLATLYGEALGLSQKNGTMLIMPISPAYTEPSDIIGFLNPNTGLYMPADTGLVDFLINAQNGNDQVHMLILDEMNLSQIEHYFAPFISLLELKENDRFLSLYSKNNICHNNEKYKSSIKINNNLIIVGTMNTDETTKDLSDRLLDRSNVVVLEKRSFIDIRNEINSNIESEYNTGQEEAYGTVYLKWKSNKGDWDAFKDEELIFFDKLDQLISEVDPQKGFSIRNIIRMGSYLNNMPLGINGNAEIERERAIDLFIKQRVITKLRGPLEIYEFLIGTGLTAEDNGGTLIKLLKNEEAQNISLFESTINELLKKSKELRLNGYAI